MCLVRIMLPYQVGSKIYDYYCIGWEILHSANANGNPSPVSAGNCFTKPIGVSDPKKIPDRQMTAFGAIVTDSAPSYGRLNGDRGNGWCSGSREDWLQVDLGKAFDICGIATQGDRNGIKWVTDFKVSYLSHGRIWTPYKGGDGKELVRTDLLSFIKK